MFKSSSPAKINSLQVSKFNYSMGHLIAEVGLFKDNFPLGEYSYPGIWSDNVRSALQALVTAIEENIAESVFGEGSTKAIIQPEDNYEEAVIHEHVEYEPGDAFDIESEF